MHAYFQGLNMYHWRCTSEWMCPCYVKVSCLYLAWFLSLEESIRVAVQEVHNWFQVCQTPRCTTVVVLLKECTGSFKDQNTLRKMLLGEGTMEIWSRARSWHGQSREVGCRSPLRTETLRSLPWLYQQWPWGNGRLVNPVLLVSWPLLLVRRWATFLPMGA